MDWVRDRGRKVGCSLRKCAIPDRSVPRQGVFDFFASEGEHEARDATRMPAEALRGAHRLAKVPVHRALDRSNVVEPRFDLDHQQGTGRFVERK
jgi:hypothetical protein